jgi:hypothetical protein
VNTQILPKSMKDDDRASIAVMTQILQSYKDAEDTWVNMEHRTLADHFLLYASSELSEYIAQFYCQAQSCDLVDVTTYGRPVKMGVVKLDNGDLTNQKKSTHMNGLIRLFT